MKPPTGLGDSFEDKFIERLLDIHAKVEVNLRYREGDKIKKGSEATIYKVFRDDIKLAAKRRKNPANMDLNYKDVVREYQSYIKEIEYMSHCNHVNIAKFEEAFRD